MAAHLEVQDAERIHILFDRLERRYVRGIFLYQGSTRMSTYTKDDFCVPKTNPDCRFSIGPVNSEGMYEFKMMNKRERLLPVSIKDWARKLLPLMLRRSLEFQSNTHPKRT